MTADTEVALRLSGLTKVFGAGTTEVDAVTDVTLTVRVGEIVLIMGPSGSGKTTLLTMIAGLLRPTRGRIDLYGQDITSLPESRRADLRRRYIGFVFQSFNLLESLTAIQNVEVALNVRGIHGRRADEKARELLTRVGLGDRLNFLPDKLSGGERQRVSIARALANDAPLILADEPTANLDSRNGRGVVSVLHDLAKTDNRTVIIVSHDARIREVADRILWLEDGRLKRRVARRVVPGQTATPGTQEVPPAQDGPAPAPVDLATEADNQV
jgi:putative ABC transport system ATP-binding protein